VIRWLMGDHCGSSSGVTIWPSRMCTIAVAIRGGFGIVRNHQHGLPQILVRLAQHVENDVRAFRIQVAGGLVGEHDRGAVDKSAASATRCCSPPESSFGLCSSRSAMPASR